MRHLFNLVIALLSLTVVASCIDRPDCVLDEGQLTDVLVDVHRAEGLLEMQQQHPMHPDENERYQREVIAAVLHRHGVTRAQYDSSLMWYAQHLKLLTRVYTHVDERLNEENELWSLQVSEAKTFNSSVAGDSVELWTLRDHLVLDSKRLTDVRYWEVPADTNYLAGDTLHWHFFVRQLLPGQKVIASMSLTAPLPEMDNRSGVTADERKEPLGYAVSVIEQTGHHSLSLCADSLETFRSAILGLVLMEDSLHVGPVFADSITLIRTHLRKDE